MVEYPWNNRVELSARMCDKNEPITTDTRIAMRMRNVYHRVDRALSLRRLAR